MRACAASAAAIRSAMAMQAAAMGWWVANQVRPMAMVSPAVLRAMLETGSGLGVIAARAAYAEGEDWLNQLVAYIDGNHDTLLIDRRLLGHWRARSRVDRIRGENRPAPFPSNTSRVIGADKPLAGFTSRW